MWPSHLTISCPVYHTLLTDSQLQSLPIKAEIYKKLDTVKLVLQQKASSEHCQTSPTKNCQGQLIGEIIDLR